MKPQTRFMLFQVTAFDKNNSRSQLC